MAKVENDETRGIAAPFLIITGPRTGGTYLAHCLSNHPQIFCERGEPMHHESVWRRKVAASAMLDLLTGQHGYHASGCKLMYHQTKQRGVAQWLERTRPRAIHLVRQNTVEQAASVIYNKEVRRGRASFRPQHTFDQVGKPAPIECGAARFLAMCRALRGQVAAAAMRIEEWGSKVLPVAYEGITGGDGQSIPEESARRICKFLGVDYARLYCELQKVNRYPPVVMFSNWTEIAATLQGTEFGKFVR